MNIYEVKDHAPSLLPDGMEFELVWADEFDAPELDTNKWDYRLCMMGKRHPSWTDKGVTFENSCAVFKIFEEDGEIVTSQLQTGYNFMDQPVESSKFWGQDLQWPIGRLRDNKFTKRYGYFECRCRTQQKPGWWSAFWLQSPMIGASKDAKLAGAEVDVLESFTPGTINKHTIVTGGYGLDMKYIQTGRQDPISTDEFHTFGVLWTEDKYVFYIDGEEDGMIDQNVSGVPLFILISAETNGYRFNPKRPTEEAMAAARAGDTFLVDHVRVFDIK